QALHVGHAALVADRSRAPVLAGQDAQRAPAHPPGVHGVATGEGLHGGDPVRPAARAAGLRAQARTARGGARRAHSMRAASSKDSRGERGNSWAGSPWPRFTRMFECTDVPLKKASSTMALSKPLIGPQSSPSARAATIR